MLEENNCIDEDSNNNTSNKHLVTLANGRTVTLEEFLIWSPIKQHSSLLPPNKGRNFGVDFANKISEKKRNDKEASQSGNVILVLIHVPSFVFMLLLSVFTFHVIVFDTCTEHYFFSYYIIYKLNFGV